jgi:hypothetical protein
LPAKTLLVFDQGQRCVVLNVWSKKLLTSLTDLLIN